MTTNKERIAHRKLAQLANFLDDLPHDRFHMPTWVASDATENSCGTAGCACGWAATVFAKEGWSIENVGAIERMMAPMLRVGNEVFGTCAAFSKFFAISQSDVEWITLDLWGHSPRGLSYCDEYGLATADCITPRHAADRIRKVLRRVDPEALIEVGESKPQMAEMVR